jgi:uncharacterized membrane protein YdjX (TVP38/TMEM64 family)
MTDLPLLARILIRFRSLMTRRMLAVGIAILTLALLAIAFLKVTNTTLNPASIRSALGRLGIWGPLALVVALAGVLVVPVAPASAFQIAAGLAFGPFIGLGCVLVADIAGASIGFWLARNWGKSLLGRYLSSVTQARVADLASRLSWQGVILLRLLPGPVYPVISFAAGYSTLNYMRFILASVTGVLPGLVLLVLAGDLAEHSPLLTIAVILFFVACLAVVRHLRLPKSEHKREPRK